MRILSFVLLVSFLSVGLSTQSFAGRATEWSFIYHKGHQHKFDPYMGEQKLRQRSTRDMDRWRPVDWIENPGDEKIILRDFYTMGIIREQYVNHDNIPVLRVGDAFVNLATFDQRRILAFVDYVFNVTGSQENGMFFVYYERDDSEPLGVYNKSGYIFY
ncbi:MAG: hypothetical protein ACLFP8_09235 [Alphaproteobacteria bacterium]